MILQRASSQLDILRALSDLLKFIWFICHFLSKLTHLTAIFLNANGKIKWWEHFNWTYSTASAPHYTHLLLWPRCLPKFLIRTSKQQEWNPRSFTKTEILFASNLLIYASSKIPNPLISSHRTEGSEFAESRSLTFHFFPLQSPEAFSFALAARCCFGLGFVFSIHLNHNHGSVFTEFLHFIQMFRF